MNESNRHEYISGYYRVSVYFLSKVLSDIFVLRTIPAAIFSVVSYFMIGTVSLPLVIYYTLVTEQTLNQRDFFS